MSENDEPSGAAPSFASAQPESAKQQWGRVLVAGGTNWSKLGRKDKSGAKTDDPERPDLLEPHILRTLSNVKITSVHTSSSSCHFIALDIDGNAWMFGRNQPHALGSPSNGFDEISECAPRKVTATSLGAPLGTTLVHAACGRGHSLLVGSNGDMWAAGGNQSGQCGRPPCSEVTSFSLIKGPILAGKKPKVTKVGAGISFSACLTDDGKVWTFGSAENGQLGNGKTGEHISTGNKLVYDSHADPVLVRGLEDVKIIEFSCGNQHTICLDDNGNVYTFGYNGYCRLGLGHQTNQLKATMVPQFNHPENPILRAVHVYAGSSCSVVVNGQLMFWLCGKFKNTGDGSSGQPWTTFKHLPEVMSCKIDHVALGGVTLWALSRNDDNSRLTIGWGQNAANGELGLGPNEVKSAVKPLEILTLKGIDVIDVAAGQYTTYFLARPSEKLSDLPRHPAEVDNSDECVGCSKGEEGNSPLVCERCDNPYHLKCLNPPLESIPEGEWFCPDCQEQSGAPIFAAGQDGKRFAAENPPKKARGRPKKADKDEDEEPKAKVTKRKSSDNAVKKPAKKRK